MLGASIIYGNELEFKIDSEKIIFNRSTTVEHFKNLFPNSEISDYTDEGGGYICYLSFNTNVPENGWRFYFDKKGYLLKFHLSWWLC